MLHFVDYGHSSLPNQLPSKFDSITSILYSRLPPTPVVD